MQTILVIDGSYTKDKVMAAGAGTWGWSEKGKERFINKLQVSWYIKSIIITPSTSSYMQEMVSCVGEGVSLSAEDLTDR